MAEDTQEIEQSGPVREVQLGEWFKPFPIYERLQDSDLTDLSRLGESKTGGRDVYFDVISIGKIRFTLFYDSDYLGEYHRDREGILVLPWGNQLIQTDDVREVERKVEARILDPMTVCEEDKYLGKNLPYKIEIILPSDEVFYSFFEQEGEGDPPDAIIWYNHDDEMVDLLIPEAENIIENLEIRVMPIID